MINSALYPLPFSDDGRKMKQIKKERFYRGSICFILLHPIEYAMLAVQSGSIFQIRQERGNKIPDAKKQVGKGKCIFKRNLTERMIRLTQMGYMRKVKKYVENTKKTYANYN